MPGAATTGSQLHTNDARNVTFIGVDTNGQGGIAVVKPDVHAHNGVLIGVSGMLKPPKSLRECVVHGDQVDRR